ncbi:hypothetical protein VTI28DRAFT_4469 [Corynascus sepedonium]
MKSLVYQWSCYLPFEDYERNFRPSDVLRQITSDENQIGCESCRSFFGLTSARCLCVIIRFVVRLKDIKRRCSVL